MLSDPTTSGTDLTARATELADAHRAHQASWLQSLQAEGGGLAKEIDRVRRRDLGADNFGMLLDWVLHLRVTRGRAARTVENYLSAVSLFIIWTKARQIGLQAVSAAHVETWAQSLYLEHHDSVSTRNGKLAAVRQFFRWREAQGLGPNPATAVPGPKRAKHLPKVYTPAQLKQLIGACDVSTPQGLRDRAVLLFILATGARRTEVSELDLSHITIRDQVGGVIFRGKGAKQRRVGFEGPAVPAMRSWLLARDALDIEIFDPEAVFVSMGSRGQGHRLGPQGLVGIIRRAHKKSGLKLEPGKALHALRATYATAMYDQSGDIRTVQLLLGHNNINTTEQYIAVSQRQLRSRLHAGYFEGIT